MTTYQILVLKCLNLIMKVVVGMFAVICDIHNMTDKETSELVYSFNDDLGELGHEINDQLKKNSP